MHLENNSTQNILNLQQFSSVAESSEEVPVKSGKNECKSQIFRPKLPNPDYFTQHLLKLKTKYQTVTTRSYVLPVLPDLPVVWKKYTIISLISDIILLYKSI